MVAVNTPKEMADRLHIGVRLLYLLSNRTPEFYRIYQIPKRNGKSRTIEAPAPILKRVQRKILERLLPGEVSGIATAFEPGRNIRANAGIHCGAEVILGLDLKDFFPSLRYGLVRRLFDDFPPEVAVLLAKLCTLYGHLPQGAPTSPHLANLLLKDFDSGLEAFCRERGVAVTRYADDLTFSGHLDDGGIRDLIRYCRAELGKLNLRLNNRKIRVLRRGARQLVTGLVVNDNVGVPREEKRRLRQRMYYLNKHWEAEFRELDEPALDALLGQANFIWDMDRGNAEFAGYRRQLLEIKHGYRVIERME